MSNNTHGGQRQKAGRPRKPTTKLINFRVTVEQYNKAKKIQGLSAAFKEWLGKIEEK